ncbi:RrF2 family transcriptional regulator [Dactylococcopsis salina]|uniref:Rrf2 family protein, putative transcriptional regulator n=1 Tax=Dactylococcopsis salina (strain PCC 8305) TaxID=13035 RepID=K9YQP6_DACS8|nr:Rrf2 family transcriptional regulator [Dactylococcopsis salina]AFZ49229.1 rrf2 family protein, putative transcriptional regulator [Dactylococcopsis salina PCC 8305]
MELSCKTKYALLALLELTSNYQNQEPLQIRQIAEKQDISDRYLEQLLATLRRGGFVKSQRGAKGGYLLARSPSEITLLEIVKCLEGSEGTTEAISKFKTPEQCVVQETWHEIDRAMEAQLKKYNLQTLSEQRNNKQQIDLMYYI